MDIKYPFFHFEGTHQEIWRQMGEACRKYIRLYRDFALDRLGTRAGISSKRALDLAIRYRPFVIKYAPFLDDEIAGVAEGVGFSIEEGYLLQLRSELAVPLKAETNTDKDMDECTSFSVLRSATVDQTPLSGQNADLPSFYRDVAIVVEICSNGFPDVLMLIPAGQVSHIGINDQGMSVFGNFLKSDGWQVGYPRYLYSRLVLSKNTVEDGANMLEKIQRASSRNLLLTDALGQALDLEISPSRIGRIQPEKDYLVHTNHFVSEEMVDAERRTEDLVENSKVRLSRIQ